MSPKVAIIGAGMAGLSCAHSLKQAGISSHIFEREAYIGGRLSSAESPFGSYSKGCDQFDANYSDFSQFISTNLQTWHNSQWQSWIVDIENGGFIARDEEQTRYIGLPQMENTLDPLSKGLSINFNTCVQEIEFTRGGWRLFDDNSENLGLFDFLVLAIPAQASRDLLGHDPHSRDLNQQIQDAELTPCWVVAVHFENSLNLIFDGAYHYEQPISWIARANKKSGKSHSGETWLLHATPEWTETHIMDSKESVIQRLSRAFQMIHHDPSPATFGQAHLWQEARTLTPAGHLMLCDQANKIGLCGDWLSGKQLENAFNSGQQLARSLIQQFNAA